MAIVGNFSGSPAADGRKSSSKQQEIIRASADCLDLLRVDTETGSLILMGSYRVFAIIRSITPVRLTGSTKGNSQLQFYLI